jgi:RNA recognition motif-containing protein
MSKKLFVGNIEWSITQEELQELFGQFGEVEEAIIIKDRETNRSKGFGFVTFVNSDDADKAVEGLDGYEFNGRNIAVNEARPPKKRF